MVAQFFRRRTLSWVAILYLVSALLSLNNLTLAQDIQYVQTTSSSGEVVYVPDNRKPSLYTQNFGDCLGESLITVTRFDAAYYQDNMTVLFHLEGNTNVANESIMMYIGVYAYGESRFDLTFNPCNAQIYSLCPMNRSIPIEANGIIPVSQSDVKGIPPIALSIPDFEGQAILRIFGNSTKSEIGCYSAVVTNGATFGQPKYIGTVLGLFTLVALGASLATTIYGDHVPTMRNHYAHSLSIFVVFAVFQHIFFTGALSMNWPSVLGAWWSNFAWSAGMIYSESMQDSINHFLGANKGNTSSVGAASTGASSDDLGGGYQLSQIYKRGVFDLSGILGWRGQPELSGTGDLRRHLAKRALATSANGYSWYGDPVKPGLPLPGNYSGFAGTLSAESIPASNAFLTGFLWLLILVVLIVASIVSTKWTTEALIKANLVKTNRLIYFRRHWISYSIQAILRTCFIAYFMLVFLAMFQFSYRVSAGPTAVAAIIFIIIFVGMSGIVGYACFRRLRFGHNEKVPGRVCIRKKTVLGSVPWYRLELESQMSKKSEQENPIALLPWIRVKYIDGTLDPAGVHEDEEYTFKFGWLASRFRRTRWWFFALWQGYEFIRACFYGGAAAQPLAQVFGLLVVEVIALITFAILRPFEGTRLNVLMVYLLGFSKVSTLALSAAFDARFNVARIIATALGIVIIVIQGLLVIALLILIAIGAVSSYMSMTRNQEDFKPRSWEKSRRRYFTHIQKTAPDRPTPPPPAPEEPKGPYFHVAAVRRNPKIEDEDEDFIGSIHDPLGSRTTVGGPPSRLHTAGPSRSNSIHNQLDGTASGIPFGARTHRTSWSTHEFDNLRNTSKRDSRIDPSTRNSRVWSATEIQPKISDINLQTSGQQRNETPLKSDEGLDKNILNSRGEKNDATDKDHGEEQANPEEQAKQ